MHKLLKVFMEIFISVRDDDNNNIAKGKYAPRKRIPKKCDNCSITPDKIYHYKATYLCKKCYDMTIEKFGEVKTKK